jgi:hypothetical protein
LISECFEQAGQFSETVALGSCNHSGEYIVTRLAISCFVQPCGGAAMDSAMMLVGLPVISASRPLVARLTIVESVTDFVPRRSFVSQTARPDCLAPQPERRRGGPYGSGDHIEYNHESEEELHWQGEISKERHGLALRTAVAAKDGHRSMTTTLTGVPMDRSEICGSS